MRLSLKTLGRCIILITLLFLTCKRQDDGPAISSDGVQIVYRTQAEGMPALVFVHGWSNNKSIWDAQVAHFSERYQVVTLDLAGFGDSGNNRQDWTMSAFGEDVKAVIDKLKLKHVVIVGFSLGGPVAIETANKLPGVVDGIVIVDEMQNIEMECTPEMAGYLDSMFMDIVTNPALEKMGYFFRNNREESYQRVLSMIKDNPKIGWRESIAEYVRWHTEDCINSLNNLKCQMIAISSDQEPTNAAAIKKHVPSFKLKLIPDVGHVVMWDATEKFNSLLEESIQEFAKD